MAKTTTTTPKKAAPTSPPSGGKELAALRQAAKRRADAEARYMAALRAAVDAVGYAEAARQLGITRQGIRQLLLRRQ